MLVVDEEEEESEENLKACECRSLITDHKPIPVNILEIYVETHHVSDNEPFQFLFTVSLRKLASIVLVVDENIYWYVLFIVNNLLMFSLLMSLFSVKHLNFVT